MAILNFSDVLKMRGLTRRMSSLFVMRCPILDLENATWRTWLTNTPGIRKRASARATLTGSPSFLLSCNSFGA